MCFKFLLGSSLLVLKSLMDVEGGGGGRVTGTIIFKFDMQPQFEFK